MEAIHFWPYHPPWGEGTKLKTKVNRGLKERQGNIRGSDLAIYSQCFIPEWDVIREHSQKLVGGGD